MLQKNKLKFFIPFSIFIPYYCYCATYFDKQIQVKNKYIKFNKKNFDKNSYMILDNNNTIYLVGDKWWIGSFRNAENWNYLEINKKYNIKGYYTRIPILDIYPIIYSIENNEK